MTIPSWDWDSVVRETAFPVDLGCHGAYECGEEAPWIPQHELPEWVEANVLDFGVGRMMDEVRAAISHVRDVQLDALTRYWEGP